MPTYVFKDEDGLTHDVFFPAADAPRIGDEIAVEGVTMVRVPHFHLDAGGIARKTNQYPFVSRSLPKGCCPDSEVKSGLQKGCPIIRSQAHEREVLARTKYVRE